MLFVTLKYMKLHGNASTILINTNHALWHMKIDENLQKY